MASGLAEQAFGHKFRERVWGAKLKERSPVFFQFLDAVWQLQRAPPTAFEFNQQLPLYLVDALCAPASPLASPCLLPRPASPCLLPALPCLLPCLALSCLALPFPPACLRLLVRASAPPPPPRLLRTSHAYSAPPRATWPRLLQVLQRLLGLPL